jgi:hypothetical protein
MRAFDGGQERRMPDPFSLQHFILQFEFDALEIAGFIVFVLWVGRHLWHDVKSLTRKNTEK